MDHLKKLLPCCSDAPLTISESESETRSDVSPPPSTLAIEDAQIVEDVQDVVVFPDGNFEIPNSFEIPSEIGPVECELFLEKILGFQEAYEVGQGTTDAVAIHVKPPNYMNSNVGSFVVKAFWFNEANKTQCDHRSAKFQNESTIFALCSEHKNVLKYYGSFKLLFDEKKSHFIATTAMDISKAIIGQRRLMGCILMPKFTCTFVDYLKNSSLEQTDGPNTEALFYQIGSALSFMIAEKCAITMLLRTTLASQE